MTDSTDEEQSKQEPSERRESEDEFTGFEDEHLYEDWDELSEDPEEVSRLGKTIEGLLPSALKRGLDDLVSEERLQSIARQKELPREVVGFIAGQVDATKSEVLRVVSREVRMFLQNVDLGGELTKILTSVSFEIRTEVRFIPNDAAFEPEVKNKVSIRGQDGSKKTLSDTEADDETDKEDEDDDSEETEKQQKPEGRSARRWGFRRRNEDQESSDEDGDGG